MTLPSPDSERWKPLRAGLVDMFYYDAEEFHFHDGRLLLRGNNGTGKSKVLALTLPFLLDGELSPHRVEPDGDRQKRMEWNLLLGGRHPHPERTGYTWLEFGRRTSEGGFEYRTIGCGLKAVKDRGITKHWFFVTGERVGAGVALVSGSGVTVTREKLRDALEGRGTVYDRALDYRRAVDAALFGLGEHRYDALVNLLIQIRQPQLSKKPDEKLLSRALTEALPPLSTALVGTVAEAFRGLDEERDALRALEEASQAASGFLRHYQGYAAIAAKRKAGELRIAHSRYEHLGRDLIEAEQRLASARQDIAEAEEKLKTLADERVKLEARQTALRQSPEMRDAQRLKETGEEARRLVRFAQDRTKDATDHARHADRAEGKARELDRRSARAEADLSAAFSAALEAAELSGCADRHREAVAGWESDPTAVRRAVEDVAANREHAVAELERLFADAARARARWENARGEVERLTGELQRAAERIALAEERVSVEIGVLTADYLAYLAGLVELRVPDSDGVLAALESWSGTASGVNPAASLVHDAARDATAALARADGDLQRAQAEHRGRADTLRAEIARLESGVTAVPPVPHFRDGGARDGRPGAPLWKAVEFAEALSPEHRAGLEAALEASGLLDGWITPDGGLLDAEDSFLLTGSAISGPSCADVLMPSADRADPAVAPLTDTVIAEVLGRIGLGPGGTTWVSVDGTWANGPLGGRWRKENAVYVGQGAREAARRERLAAARAELAVLEAALEGLAAERARLAARQSRLTDEHRGIPPDTPLREAHLRLAGEHRGKRDLDQAHATAAGVAERRRGEADAARVRATEFALDVGLPEEPASLPAVKTALADYRLALAPLWPMITAVLDARTTVKEAAAELAELRERAAEAAFGAEEARAAATTADETYRALVETAGAGVEELFRGLRAVEQAIAERASSERDVRGLQEKALLARGTAEGSRETLQGQIRQAVETRDRAVTAFRAFAGTGILALALPGAEIPDAAEPWSPTAAVQLARATNAALESVADDDGPWDRAQKRVAEEHKILSDTMSRHGHSVGLTLRDGIMLVDVVFHGRTRDIPELAAALAEEKDHRATLLSAREREILENHLLNEVAGTLHELILAGEEEVAAMNGELNARPTSTGMTLRLIWRPAKKAPEGLDRVRAKLRQTIDAWTEEDRTSVGAFLQDQIAREHTENPSAGWTEQLTRALDYRSWHEFAIQRLQDGQWRAATGPASGGERVLAASVPLFAAASAYYKSAGNPHAPRLVALDEAFAGVDDDSRAKCLGLLATFDMDVVMTSEREWGCYPQVPGLAICQLSRRDGIDAVLVTPWRWDGRERTRAPRPDAFRLPEPSEPVASEETLFS
ncbi:TIGR02680 family protein [Actinocorallia sp. API 0066]|uniref:TIGR02680 family protein n=1 Tax=Actinocorallia sp. API 0066 TaxID=2896846 RepID=UPI001E4521B0|nr:TIGR02680 family protein [Actinocorallia sp. API 0066]MCD0450480.1 TIGR02680 family protein [Actinocorallia sp. API 0066]